jgi:GDPmannose 4,6-dehydratase
MTNKNIALITGITGQDGSYLAEFLLDKGYYVHGVIRRTSSPTTNRIEHLFKNRKLKLHYGDLTDSFSIMSIIKKVKPTEIYNLAAQSHVKISFEVPEHTTDVDALGTLRILESVRLLGMEKKVKIYQASTSEMFGNALESPQSETTPFNPRSPYGVSKIYGYYIVKNYRESYNMFACSGILFNHESSRRGENFVTKKITQGLYNISIGKQNCLYLGNLNAKRDWGHAKDYVRATWMILQQKTPKDYVVSLGEQHSVRDFVEESAKYFNISIKWKNKGIKEIGIDENTGKVIIRIDKNYFRPSDSDALVGDSSKARKELGWKPEYNFQSLVKEMCEDLLK